MLSNPTSTPGDLREHGWKNTEKPGAQKQTPILHQWQPIYASTSSYSYCCHIMVYKHTSTHICPMYTSNHNPSILQYWSSPIILLWSKQGVPPFLSEEPSIGQPFWLASSAPVTISLCFICVTRQPRHPVMPKPGNEFSGIHYSGLVYTCSVNFFSILLPASISYEDLPVHNIT